MPGTPAPDVVSDLGRPAVAPWLQTDSTSYTLRYRDRDTSQVGQRRVGQPGAVHELVIRARYTNRLAEPVSLLLDAEGECRRAYPPLLQVKRDTSWEGGLEREQLIAPLCTNRFVLPPGGTYDYTLAIVVPVPEVKGNRLVGVPGPFRLMVGVATFTPGPRGMPETLHDLPDSARVSNEFQIVEK